MDNKILIGTIVSLAFLFGVFVYSQYKQTPAENRNNQPAQSDERQDKDKNNSTSSVNKQKELQKNSTSSANQNDDTEITRPDVEVVAKNLEIPWGITFLPNGDMLVTERPGRLLRIDKNGAKTPITLANSSGNIPGTKHVGEGGLLGVALHPNYSENNIIYLYQTSESESGDRLINRVEQYKLVDNQLKRDSDTKTIIDNIPGAVYHDGGRIAFGPDGKLYITAGDATNEDWAQIYQSGTKKDLAGSILRLNPDGSIPQDNPFDSPVWSYGHRNPQGLTWDNQGRLWSTEHGRSGLLSGLDEINLIKPGNNYGWPDSEGDTVKEGTVGPVEHSGADTTWAPASALYWGGSIFFGGLRGEALYEAILENGEMVEVKSHFKNKYGRIRTVVKGPDGMFYLTTSNRDGRGSPVAADDRIIRVNSEIFR